MKFALTLTYLLVALLSQGQSAAIFPQYNMGPKSGPIDLNGEISEESWQNAEVATNFWLNAPIDGKQSEVITKVRMVYDDQNIYVSFECYDHDEYVIQSLKRDNLGDSDEVVIFIDPVGQKTNAMAFGVNAEGAQSEALIFVGNSEESWDNKWFSAVKQYEDRWVVEMAIPFKTLRYEAGKDNWKVNFGRLDPAKNET